MLERNDRSGWIGRLVQLGAIATLCAGLALAAGAEAQRKGKKRGKPAPEPAAPVSAEIAKNMGDLRWGMSKDEVLAWIGKQLKEKYKPELAKATDAVTEDRIRHRMTEEVRTVHDSYVRFDGKTTGWDLSYLRDEFTHKNQESMLVLRDRSSQNHYFFINDKLWKWYKAFDAKVFQGKSFDQFAQAVQGRFGEAREGRGEQYPGAGERQWLEWQDETTRLRAVDQTHFYGFYCLVFEDKQTLDRLAMLRRNAPQRRAATHAVVESVTSGDTGRPDHSPDIVDRITGKSRNRGPAPAANTRGRQAPPRSAPSEPAGTPSTVGASDDPLRGLDF